MNEHDVNAQKLKFYKQMSELIIKSPLTGFLKLILFLAMLLGGTALIVSNLPSLIQITNNYYYGDAKDKLRESSSVDKEPCQPKSQPLP